MGTEIYRATQGFPREEMFGLTSQLRRSAGSVASNIAEGQGRLSKGKFRQFLGQARGSLIEMETQLVIAGNLGFLSSNTIAALIDLPVKVSRLLHGLMKSLQPAEPTARTRNQKLETAPSAKLCHLYG
jgi:four helix bundle protein